MSREQVERILRTDTHSYDDCVEQQIQDIKQITQSLTQRSNFIITFQQMLQQEMENLDRDAIPVKSRHILNQSPSNGAIEQSFLKSSQYRHLPTQQAIRPTYNCLQDITNYAESRRQTSFSRQLTHCRQQLLDYKKMTFCFREQMKDYISEMQEHVMKELRQSMSSIIELIDKVYQNKLACLIHENEDLTRWNRLLQEGIEQRHKPTDNHFLTRKAQPKQISFRPAMPNNSSRLLENPSRFSLLPSAPPSYLDYQRQDSRLDGFKQHVPESHSRFDLSSNGSVELEQKALRSSIQWREYRYDMGHGENSKAIRNSPEDLPYFRPIVVSLPPVKNGFGVLNHDRQVVYRGMWKDGKFHGKGKLSMENYVYEGEFADSKFQGHGCFTSGKLRFIGVFRDHMANGEGTWCKEGESASGVWKNGKLQLRF